MDFSYYDNNNKLNSLNFDNIKAGQKWSEIKTNNKQLDSIFSNKRIDVNQDGKIDEKEMGLLKAFLKCADTLLNAPGKDGDGTLTNEELTELNKQLNETGEKYINVSADGKASVPDSYSLLEMYELSSGYTAVSRKVDTSGIDPSKLEKGQYYLNNEFKNGNFTAKALKVQDKTSGAVKNWSEGLNREIGTIRIGDPSKVGSDSREDLRILGGELQEIGSEVGFDVQFVHTNTPWVEDTHIRTHDGKVYLADDSSKSFNDSLSSYDVIEGIISRRAGVGNTAQGAIASRQSASEYAKTVPQSEQIRSGTYLEGGNVLNTLKANGKPGAIIGEESVDYTLKLMKLDKTESNVAIAKGKIAQDLNLKPEDVTYIPQFDFHIDMGYRHLDNGQVAVPDYRAGIEYLENNDIKSMDPQAKQELIEQLKKMEQEAGPIMKEAEDALSQGGYKLIKMPCFSVPRTKNTSPINYMNGVAGTSTAKGSLPKGTKYYITNKSEYPEINQYMEKFLKDNAGIEKTYFVSTTNFLNKSGGIDCLTEEYAK